MPRSRSPLSKRNARATFTGAEVRRALDAETLAASKKARVVRSASEFDVRQLAQIMRAPLNSSAAYSWSIEDIVKARDAQMVGRFRLPARLSESMGTDDALFTARGVRLAPVQGLDVVLEAAAGGKSDKIADEASALFGPTGIAISPETVTSIRRDLVEHGVAVGYNDWSPRADGSRVDVVHRAWPIEHVWWHEVAQCYVTTVRLLDCDDDPSRGDMVQPYGQTVPLEPILHGNGRWVVYRKAETLPHRLDAALLPAALVWACHAFARRDWTKGSAAHGNAKVVGELPEGQALSDSEGNLTTEAAAFLTLVADIASQDSPVGIRPPGSKVDYITNSSRAWEVWAQLLEMAERAAARIYLGTDGVLGAQGGAPGVDISELFGVATSKIQSDLVCVERAVQSGVIAPWCAVNFGDDTRAPLRRYVFPDPDLARVREDFAKRNAAFNADVTAYRANGFVVDQPLIDRVAELHGVPAPQLPSVGAATATGSPIFAYHMQAGVVTVNEVRQQLGLPPLEDGDQPATGASDSSPTTEGTP